MDLRRLRGYLCWLCLNTVRRTALGWLRGATTRGCRDGPGPAGVGGTAWVAAPGASALRPTQPPVAGRDCAWFSVAAPRSAGYRAPCRCGCHRPRSFEDDASAASLPHARNRCPDDATSRVPHHASSLDCCRAASRWLFGGWERWVGNSVRPAGPGDQRTGFRDQPRSVGCPNSSARGRWRRPC